MKNTREAQLPVWLERTLFGGLVAVFILMPFHAFLSTWGGTTIGPLWMWKSWKELLIAALCMALVISIATRRDLLRAIYKDRLLQMLVIFAGWFLVMAVIYHHQNGTAATAVAAASDLRYLAAFGLVYIVFKYGSTLQWQVWQKRAIIFLLVVTCLVAVFGILQATVLPNDLLAHFGYDKVKTIAPYTLIDQNPDAPRAFGTLRGPNDFAAFLILPILLCFTGIKRKWLAWCVAGVFALGLFYSASRSAWIGSAAAIVAFLGLRFGRRIFQTKRAVVSAISIVIAVLGIGLSAFAVPSVRLAIFHSQTSDTSLTEGSTDDHLASLRNGLTYVVKHPLGCGPGCAGPASYYSNQSFISENYYLQLAEELGVVGLALWLVIAMSVGKKLYDARADWLAQPLLASFIGLSVIGLLLHVWADDPLSLTWWLLAGALLGNQFHGKRRIITPKA